VRRIISTSVDGGQVEGLACANPGARTPIGASGDLVTTDVELPGVDIINVLKWKNIF
jgi:hypothetical protein